MRNSKLLPRPKKRSHHCPPSQTNPKHPNQPSLSLSPSPLSFLPFQLRFPLTSILTMSMNTAPRLPQPERIPKQRTTSTLLESLLSGYSEERPLGSRGGDGRLRVGENKDLRGGHAFFLDSGGGEVDYVAAEWLWRFSKKG